MNFPAIFVAALIPMLTGMVWYNPKVFGNVWMKSIGVSDPEKMKEGANMAMIFGMAFVFALLLSLAMGPLVIHQYGIASLLADMPEAAKGNNQLLVNGNPVDYAEKFRTFGHGVFHGTLFGVLIAIPLIGTNALFERRGFSYIAIHAGYWILNMALMGGLICAWK